MRDIRHKYVLLPELIGGATATDGWQPDSGHRATQ